MFLQRSAKECGLDSRNLPPPALFPDICLHSTGDQKLLSLMQQQEQQQQIQELKNDPEQKESDDAKAAVLKELSSSRVAKRSSQTLFLISKGREMHHRMQSSAFYVRPTKYVPDVIRYSDSTRPPPRIDASAVLSNCLGGQKETVAGRYVPEELISGQVLGPLSEQVTAGGKAVNLQSLEANEKMIQKGQTDNSDEDDERFGENIDNNEEDDGEDYVMNYYESDGDESDGGDNEATF